MGPITLLLSAASGHTAQEVCRLAHEALVNASRHGRATRATMRLCREGGEIHFRRVELVPLGR